MAHPDASAPDGDPPPVANASSTSRVPLTPVLTAITRALDLAEGQRPGHALRTCLIGMRLGQATGLDDDKLAALYYALLLKDLGGTANAASVATAFGADDQRVKARLQLLDRDDRRRLLAAAWHTTAPGAALTTRAARFGALLRERDLERTLLTARAERGAELAQTLGFPTETVEAIRSLDERHDGRGYPSALRGDAIPILARLIALARAIELHLTQDGAVAATAMIRARAGRWFDPQPAASAIDLLQDDALLAALQAPDIEHQVFAVEPAGCAHDIDDNGLDEIAGVLARVVDAKSPYLTGYSPRVAHHARVIGARLGFDAGTLRALYRAGLLHDLGMVAVSSRILEKPQPLNAAERTEIEHHPLETWEILHRTPGFDEVALLAATHHEKLDGTGYPWRRGEDDLDGPARTLAVADVFVAAMTDRSFRKGLAPNEALMILDAQRGLRLDADAVDALAACVEAGEAGAIDA